MKKAVVTVNGVPTYVATWGAWIDDDLQNHKNLIVCVAGNPGVTGYYDEFLGTVHESLNIPVWIVSHAGQEIGKDVKIPPTSQNTNLYNLEGQIQHKIEFLKKYVPSHINIYLIGHSIGSYMLLQILKNYPEINGRVKKVYMLFPTIQKMKESPNGKFLTGYVQPVVFIVIFLSWIFTLFPVGFRKIILHAYFTARGIKTKMVKPTLKLINPKVLRNVFFLAEDEMNRVNELDHDLIDQFADKLFFYFGTSDGWVPLSYYEDLKKNHPKVHALTTNYRHAFVLDASKEVASNICKWIKSEPSKIKAC